jgi:hypothetical protein
MLRLSINQRRLLAEFCANFAVAWFVAGTITPLFSETNQIKETIITGVSWGSVLLILGISLVGGRKK